MDIKNYRICNNKKINIIRQRDMKSIIIWFMYYMNLDENASKNMLISNLLLRGSGRYKTSREISRFLYKNYGATAGIDVNLKGEIYTLSIYVNFINDKLWIVDKDLKNNMINFIKDVICNPYLVEGLFDTNYFETEKQNLIGTIRNKVNNKDSYAFDRCIEIMCDGEAYEIDKFGKEKWVKDINNLNLIKRYHEILDMPLNIYIMGDIEGDEYIQDIVKTFEFKDGITVYPKRNKFQRKESIIEYNEKIEVNQGKLCLGFRTGVDLNSILYPALVIINKIFGGGTQSKLFKSIREENSLCYNISSLIEKYKELLFVECGISPSNYQKVKDLIISNFNDIKEGKFSDEDIDNAITSTKYTLINMKDNYLTLISYYEGLDIYNSDYTLDEFINKIQGVTRKDIEDCANKIELDTIYFLGKR